jgi:hypothetical protein
LLAQAESHGLGPLYGQLEALNDGLLDTSDDLVDLITDVSDYHRSIHRSPTSIDDYIGDLIEIYAEHLQTANNAPENVA